MISCGWKLAQAAGEDTIHAGWISCVLRLVSLASTTKQDKESPRKKKEIHDPWTFFFAFFSF